MGTSPSADCIFCAIVEGRAPASFVHRDDAVVAFLDIRPITPGHLLVVPRRHLTAVADLDDATTLAVWRTGFRLADAMRRAGLRFEGANYLVADGWAAGQEVAHFHLHVVPRFGGDGFGFRFPSDYDKRPARLELDLIAERIRAALAG